MDQTDIWMIGVVVSGVAFYLCTLYFSHDN